MSTPTAVPASHVDAIIDASTITVAKLGDKTCVMHATLPNGFETVVTSSCVNPDDYDAEIGERICRDRLRDKVWELEGYVAHGLIQALPA